MYVIEEPAPRRFLALAFVVLGVAVAPLVTAAWALVRFWPTSGVVWLAAAVMFWFVSLRSATEDNTVR
jgi:4-hydroxybenzoate polyprenyltransferase